MSHYIFGYTSLDGVWASYGVISNDIPPKFGHYITGQVFLACKDARTHMTNTYGGFYNGLIFWPFGEDFEDAVEEWESKPVDERMRIMDAVSV